jgi:uncharacterized protein with HEPN domain
MSERDWRLFLNDIIECVARVIEYAEFMTRKEFFSDPKTVDAVLRT